MITLLTGQPGHGKTLRALQLACELRDAGREVFACRVTGLDEAKTRFHVLEKMEDWQSLPDGSVVLVDECYEDIPARGPSKQIPDWIQKLATHRHRGFDFILICQLGTQIDAFVRGLVDKHVHVRRKFGFDKSVLLEWDRYVGNPSSNSELKGARKKGWSYPKSVFELYRSATMHTVQKSIPWQFIGIPILLALVVGSIWFVFDRFASRGRAVEHDRIGQVEQVGDKGALAPSSRPATSQVETPPKTPAEYAEQFVPRIPSMPWSAPIFDDRKVKTNPELFCVSTEDLRCICHTEQGTRWQIDRRQCMAIARNGIYNPYRDPPARGLQTRYEAELPTPTRGGSGGVSRSETMQSDESRPAVRFRDPPKYPNQSLRNDLHESLARSSPERQ